MRQTLPQVPPFKFGAPHLREAYLASANISQHHPASSNHIARQTHPASNSIIQHRPSSNLIQHPTSSNHSKNLQGWTVRVSTPRKTFKTIPAITGVATYNLQQMKFSMFRFRCVPRLNTTNSRSRFFQQMQIRSGRSV